MRKLFLVISMLVFMMAMVDWHLQTISQHHKEVKESISGIRSHLEVVELELKINRRMIEILASSSKQITLYQELPQTYPPPRHPLGKISPIESGLSPESIASVTIPVIPLYPNLTATNEFRMQLIK